MLDSAQKQIEVIRHLLIAQALADELLDGDTMHLIERAIAQAAKPIDVSREPAELVMLDMSKRADRA